MRAAVIRQSGATPALDQFADPQPGQGLSVGTLVAAALNPLDIAIVNGQFPIRRLQPPYVAGYEAVVQFGDGTRCYLTGPPAPYGTLAELVPVPDSAGFPVPAGIDPGLAALGVAGLVGWLALDYRGHLQPGETVLVLGAGGSAGQLAMQSARVLGAGRVVGAARGKAVEQAADRGADAVVDLADDQAIDAGLAAAAPGGYDVIVDCLWGGLAPCDEPRQRRRPVRPGRELRRAHVHDRRGGHPQQAADAYPSASAHAVPADFRSSQPHPRSGMCGTFPRKRRGTVKRDDDRGRRSVGGMRVRVRDS